MVNEAALNCEHVWREISSYLDGEVDSSLRAAMDEHLRGCKRCTSVLEGTRNVLRLYSDERMIEVPAGFGRRLEKRLARDAHTSRWPTWSSWLVPVAAVALVAGGLRLANSAHPGQTVKSEHAQSAGYEIPPDLKVVVTADAKIFHVPGCDFIHDKDNLRTMTAKEAKRQGYVPCPRCLRKYLVATRRTPSEQELTEKEVVEADEARGILR